ncbi:MAG TPA: hypothetical protein ENJ65_03830 [Candidatus Tenderia electrophaga]|uniref:Uncharacterized protein n=1 Tax=Candidatus Tenderia electrophaga TaxID=1748243 RepID=A0A832J3N5_9GAMM|nr:hypothetical protein [Candidatus Tenderia electrophaga]
MERYSEQCADQKYYYQQILDCLLRAELIDFDVILTQQDGVAVPPEVVVDTVQKAVVQDLPEYDEQGLIAYLQGHAALSADEKASLTSGLNYLLNHRPQSLRRVLVGVMTDKRLIDGLISVLPEHLLSRCLVLMGMKEMQRLQLYAELMTTACHAPALTLQRLTGFKWQLLFSYLQDVGPLFNEHRFVDYFLTGLASRVEQNEQPDEQGFRAAVSQQLVVNSLPSTRAVTDNIVRRLATTAAQSVQSKTDTAAAAIEHKADSMTEDLLLEDIHISNAGLVLAAPYLPRLFEMLGLTEKSAFKDKVAAVRAVHMLQFLVDEHTDSPEYQLVLNKLLCGVKTGIPIERQVSLTEHEKEQLQGLLEGMRQNWKSLGKTTINGLRESFLQRQGRLQLKDDAWHLQLEAKPYDMLLDQLPWSYSTIKYPWMERVIYVDWR